MNLCGSSRGGGDAREVELNCCLLAGVDICGAMVVDLGLEICKHPKKMKDGEERATNCVWGKNDQPFGYLKGSKIAPLRHGVGLYPTTKHRYTTA